MVTDEVPLVASRQLLQIFAQELNKLEPEAHKEIAQYALAQIQPRVVSFEEQVHHICLMWNQRVISKLVGLVHLLLLKHLRNKFDGLCRCPSCGRDLLSYMKTKSSGPRLLKCSVALTWSLGYGMCSMFVTLKPKDFRSPVFEVRLRDSALRIM